MHSGQVRIDYSADFLQLAKTERGFGSQLGVRTAAGLILELMTSFVFMSDLELVVAERLPIHFSSVDRANLRKAFADADRVESLVEIGDPLLVSEGPSIVVHVRFLGRGEGNLLLHYRFDFIQRREVPREVLLVSSTADYKRSEPVAA